MRFKNWSLKTKMFSAYAIPVVLILSLALLAWMSLDKILNGVDMTDHTHRVIRDAVRMEGLATDLETGLRGYLLTGREEYLEPYWNAGTQLQYMFSELTDTVGYNSKQVERLRKLEQVLTSWQNKVAVPLIELRRSVGEDKDMNHLGILVGEGKGKEYLDRFREMARTFVGREEKLLETRTKLRESEADPERLREAARAVEHTHVVIEKAGKILNKAIDMETGMHGYLLTGKKEFLEPYNAGKGEVFSNIDKLKEKVQDHPEQVKLLGEMSSVLKDWVTSVAEPGMDLRTKIAGSKTMLDVRKALQKDEGEKLFDKFRGLISQFVSTEEDLLKEREASSGATETNAKYGLLIGSIGAIVLCILAVFILSGSITKPIITMTRQAKKVSEGDLTVDIRTIDRQDEIGVLYQSFAAMVDSLQSQARRILEVVNVLAERASEISVTVSELSESTSKTTAAVTESTTTIEEVKQAAAVSSEKAKDVSERSNYAAEISGSGMEATEEAGTRMNLIREQMEAIGDSVLRLSDQSHTVEEIIATVQDLADQSNLLAVNASIEAARAGDSGRGFSVVAQEIKTLADQSKEATEQVRSILLDTRKWISAVVDSTEHGSKAVESGVAQSVMAADAIRSLTDSVKESAQAAIIIDTASVQQSAGVEQVATAMTDIELAMQQNLDGSSHLEESVRKLDDLGAELKELMAHYTV